LILGGLFFFIIIIIIIIIIIVVVVVVVVILLLLLLIIIEVISVLHYNRMTLDNISLIMIIDQIHCKMSQWHN
jgi:hypothetical protein